MAVSPSSRRYALMQYHRCGRSGLKLPAISLGMWHSFGRADPFENGLVMALQNLASTQQELDQIDRVLEE